MRRAALLAGIIAVSAAVAAGAWAAGHGSRGRAAPTATAAAAIDPHVAAGAHWFVQFACGQCHGDRGRGGVSPYVPALDKIGKAFTVTQLTSIINHGLGVAGNPKRPYMPVWGPVISKAQVSDLVAYIRAGLPFVPYAVPRPIPQGQGDVVAGAALYERYGCINCHGPNGLGGVPNPLSPDGTIPPLTGQDFRNEFPGTAIAAMIRSGSVIGKAPIVSMPHWGGILSDRQIAELVAYLKTLK